jgi:hypothetical protein
MQFNRENSRSVLFKEESSGRAMTVHVLSRGTDALMLQIATSLRSLVIDRFCERLSGFSTGSRRSQYCMKLILTGTDTPLCSQANPRNISMAS